MIARSWPTAQAVALASKRPIGQGTAGLPDMTGSRHVCTQEELGS